MSKEDLASGHREFCSCLQLMCIKARQRPGRIIIILGILFLSSVLDKFVLLICTVFKKNQNENADQTITLSVHWIKKKRKRSPNSSWCQGLTDRPRQTPRTLRQRTTPRRSFIRERWGDAGQSCGCGGVNLNHSEQISTRLETCQVDLSMKIALLVAFFWNCVGRLPKQVRFYQQSESQWRFEVYHTQFLNGFSPEQNNISETVGFNIITMIGNCARIGSTRWCQWWKLEMSQKKRDT